jgi:hypothetical protein
MLQSSVVKTNAVLWVTIYEKHMQVYARIGAVLSHLKSGEGYDDDLGVHVAAASWSSNVNCNKVGSFLYNDKGH